MNGWKWPDARGWIGLGAFVLTLIVLGLLIWGPADLRKDDFFKALATLIVGCYIKDVVGWAYQATKGGGELAERNAAIVQESVSAGVAAAAVAAQQAAAALPEPGQPMKVEVTNTEDNPAKVTETQATDDRPDYAR